MVDTMDLKSMPYGSAGSSPAEATTLINKKMFSFVTLGTNDLNKSKIDIFYINKIPRSI